MRGVMPSGLAVRQGRLYVAESGINAVAVLDAAALRDMDNPDEIPEDAEKSGVKLRKPQAD